MGEKYKLHRAIACLAAALWPAACRDDGARSEPAPQTAPMASRPASVPRDFVSTPMGYFHPSCVTKVGAGEKVLGDGSIRTAGGRHRPIPACSHPRYDARGVATHPGSRGPAPKVERVWNAFFDLLGIFRPMEFLSAEWRVPANPPLVGAQTLYLFPGFTDFPDTRILQPVLAWNGREAHGPGWAIYSWNCCVGDMVFHSEPVDTLPGSKVRGWAQGSNCDDVTGVCSDWVITTETEVAPDQWIGTTLNTSVTSPMKRAFGGVLEHAGVSTCRHLPESTFTRFSNVAIREVGGGPVSGVWNPVENTQSPDCVTDLTTSDEDTVTIHYTSVDPGFQCPPGQKCCEPGTEKCELCVPENRLCP